MPSLNHFARGLLLILGLATLPLAQAAWPEDQPIRIVVPQAPGGTNDTSARIVAAELGKVLKQTVIVENRPGAASAIGMEAVSRAKPDGYTLGLASDSAALLDVLHPGKSWSFARDLVGIGMLGEQPIVVAVRTKSPFQGLPELLQAAKSHPGTMTFGSSGVGSSQHIVGEWLGKKAGAEWIHVPYKGGGQAVTDLLGGQLSFAVLGLAPMLAQEKAGNVRIVAVTTARRDPALPQVPTLAELGFPDIVLAQWAGIVAPRQIPPGIAGRLSDALQAVLHSPGVVRQLTDAGVHPRPLSAAQFQAFLHDTDVTWSRLVPTLSLKLD